MAAIQRAALIMGLGVLVGGGVLVAPVRAQEASDAFAQMRARFEKFRAEHKNTFALMQLVSGIFDLERSSRVKLTPQQAHALLDILAPLHKPPKLTQQDARAVHRKIQALLTARQITELTRLQAKRRKEQEERQRQMPAGGGGQRPSGGRQGRGGMRFDLESRRNFNPYYLPKKADRAQLPPFERRRIERLEQELQRLKEKAQSKP